MKMARALRTQSFAEDEGETEEDYCWTPLQLAAKSGHLEAVQALLRQAASPSDLVNAPAAGYYGRTALQAACESGYEDIITALLAAGAHVDADGGNNSGRTALQLACSTRSTAEIPNLQQHYKSREELLKHQDQRHRIVDRLLKAGAELNRPANKYNGRTALQAAAEAGDARLVRRLLDLGADVNAAPSATLGFTALQGACVRGHLEAARPLLDAGAHVNGPAARYRGCTALQGACLHGESTTLVDLLLTAGADPNLGGSRFQGASALHAAVEGGNIEIVRRLLAAGALVDVVAGHLPGQTPLQSAMLLEDDVRVEIEDALRTAGAAPVVGFKRPTLLFCMSHKDLKSG